MQEYKIMLVQRRSFLAGLGSLFLAPAVVKASSLMPLRGEVMLPSMPIPSWCPPGWAPANGHLVDRFQFPELHAWFKRTRQNGAHLNGQFKLPGSAMPTEWYSGYQELRIDKLDNPCIETVEVPLIAVKPMVRTNGTMAQPGMMFNYVVNAEVLRAVNPDPGVAVIDGRLVSRRSWSV
jgi:hypothetical protein